MTFFTPFNAATLHPGERIMIPFHLKYVVVSSICGVCWSTCMSVRQIMPVGVRNHVQKIHGNPSGLITCHPFWGIKQCKSNEFEGFPLSWHELNHFRKMFFRNLRCNKNPWKICCDSNAVTRSYWWVKSWCFSPCFAIETFLLKVQARLRAAAEVAGETEGLGGAVEENDATNFNRLTFYGLSHRRDREIVRKMKPSWTNMRFT